MKLDIFYAFKSRTWYVFLHSAISIINDNGPKLSNNVRTAKKLLIVKIYFFFRHENQCEHSKLLTPPPTVSNNSWKSFWVLMTHYQAITVIIITCKYWYLLFNFPPKLITHPRYYPSDILTARVREKYKQIII